MTHLDDLFADLHDVLVKELLERIKTGEATTADLNAARQLLRDNGIDVNTHREATPLLDLVDHLPYQDDTAPETRLG